MMKKIIYAFIAALVFIYSASMCQAEVKMVEMKIAGYLCGN